MKIRRSCTALALLLGHVWSSSAQDEEEEHIRPDCVGGTCPNQAVDDDSDEECGLWLGPSPIKQAEQHGFGLGVFTGKAIAMGESLDQELLLPVFDSLIQEHDTPLREYVWDADNLPELQMESHKDPWLFIPGLAAIAACTSVNYNLELSGTSMVNAPRHNVVADAGGVHRSTHPTAGAFSYRHSVTYAAVRDIVAGEELTVQCSDDNYDGGAYFLSTYHSNDNAVVCVDTNVRVDKSIITGAGQGLFAKRKLSKGQVITSTPLVPIHRKEMEIDWSIDDNDNEDASSSRSQKQLLLNYCYGHARSDLLLLPFGPLVNYINNHADSPNVAIRWHPFNTNDKLPRRQQHYHPELLNHSAEKVANTHGKGLMMDIIALRDIEPSEELFLDYGPEWNEAWKSHVENYKPGDATYISAEDYMRATDDSIVRTITEQEDDPYPENVQTTCFYDQDAPELEEDELDDEDDEDDVVYTSWVTDAPHICLRPCLILDRYSDEEEERLLYKAKMLPMEKSEMLDVCELETDHIARDIPRHAIRIVDRPYTSDAFLENAFRHEIGVPDGFFPDAWMQKNMRRRSQQESNDNGARFKRKKPAKSQQDRSFPQVD